jgi:hypothetical protein
MIGIVAPMVLNGSIKRDWIEGYVGQILVPEFKRPRVVGFGEPVFDVVALADHVEAI